MCAAFAIEAWEAIMQPNLPFYEEYLQKVTKQEEIKKIAKENPHQLLIQNIVKQEFTNAGYKIQ
jgi:hypothetical protein